jgi:hypothetical protein
MHFVALAEAVEAVLPGITGRDLRLNVSAAIPAVLLDVGFPADALKGVPILARCAGLIGHLTEELAHPIGFALSYQATREQRYTGELPHGWAPKAQGTDPMAHPLSGVRVVEHGTFITGPAAAMLLADLGADVIKVEQPAGDPFRAFRGGSYSPHYQTYNRNKKSVTLDTRQAADLALFDRLIAEADVYIQNFRPGVADKLGAGEARCAS